MDITTTVTGYMVLACATASFYKAVEQVIVKNAGTTNYALFMLLSCMGYLELSMGLLFTGSIAALPPILFASGFTVFVLMAYLAGPLAHAYYTTLITPRFDRPMLHLPLPVTAAALAAWMLSAFPSSYIGEMRGGFFHAAHGLPMHLLMAGSVLSIVVYTAKILFIELSVRNSPSIRLEVRSMIVITAGLLLSPVALLAGFLTGRMEIFASGAVLLILNNLLFILAQVRYQDFFQALGREVRQARYRRKILKGMDPAALQERLADLMEGEKYYRNFDLSMRSTADMLSITPHQLSFFLNKKLRVDFRSYINRFRVEEAKKLLAESLDRNVLTIGFNVGFGSKTAFNGAFKEFTGKTPTEFRDEQVKMRLQAKNRA